jgi:uncharacterized membrane protein YqjE
MENSQSHSEQAGQRMTAGLAGMAKNLFGLAVSRIELAALELSEVRANLLKLLLIGALGILMAWFALAYWSVLIVMLAWPSMGWKILLVLALAFTLAAIALFLHLQAMQQEGKLSMPATMAELRNDRDALLSPLVNNGE